MSDINIDLIGDEELLRALGNLDQKTQQKELKRILRDTATQTFVKRLRQAAPPSQTLKKSYGHVTGKSRRVATIFAGPRMSLKKAFGEGNQGYKGWLANIIEFNKFQPRYPGRTRAGRMKKRPKTPMGVRKHSGVFPWGPFQVRTILNTVRQAEAYQATAVRKLIIKEFKKYAKR
jgi:hypothetical protein